MVFSSYSICQRAKSRSTRRIEFPGHVVRMSERTNNENCHHHFLFFLDLEQIKERGIRGCRSPLIAFRGQCLSSIVNYLTRRRKKKKDPRSRNNERLRSTTPPQTMDCLCGFIQLSLIGGPSAYRTPNGLDIRLDSRLRKNNHSVSFETFLPSARPVL